MATKMYVGDVGTMILLDIGFDISSATELVIEVKKPDNTQITWPGTLNSTTKVQYIVLVDDLDSVGTWQLQPRVQLPSGLWRGETVKMRLYDRFK